MIREETMQKRIAKTLVPELCGKMRTWNRAVVVTRVAAR